jgi:glycosyltransferase involved in cell wall biosynthesis
VESGAKRIAVLYDIPQPSGSSTAPVDDLRAEGIKGCLALYVGNLAPYQGIDLLLESFAIAHTRAQSLDVVIIGGSAVDIAKYRAKAKALGIDSRTHFLGPKPVSSLAGYLAQADFLVSPRIKGTNTPMKLYSYLESGKPVLATNLWTHTQVLDSSSALLTPANVDAYAEGMIQMALDPALRASLGAGGKRLIDTKYNRANYDRTINALLDELEGEFGAARAGARIA